jgi:hypothetical protein
MKTQTNLTINSVISNEIMHKIQYSSNAIEISGRIFAPYTHAFCEGSWGYANVVFLDQELREVFGDEMEDSIFRSFNVTNFLYHRLREKISRVNGD